MPTEEALARIKGAVGTDPLLSIVEQSDKYLRVRATRNFATDEVVFVVNPDDHVITYSSRQVDGLDYSSDFGAQRKRLG